LVLLGVVIAAIAFCMMRSKTDKPGNVVPPAAENTPSVNGNPVSGGKTEPAAVRNAAFYQARWRMIQEESRDSGLELNQVEKFVADAGTMAPAEAVEALAELRAAEKQVRALSLRNELLDQAAAFNPDEVKKLDFDAIDTLCRAALSKRDELRKLDAGLAEHIFLPEQQKTVDAYIKQLSDLQLAVSLGGDISSWTTPETLKTEPEEKGKTEEPSKTEPDEAETAQTEPEETDPAREDPEDVDEPEMTEMDSKLLMNYLLLLDYLPGVILDEQKSAEALRLANELLSDKDFTAENPRKICLGIRKFLVLNNAPLLPYLDENEKALQGMKLFPRSYPDSVLVDISGSTIRLKVKDDKANITQRKNWSQLRREEGEDRIIVTLINSPQLAKLNGDTREYLYVRALFLGVDPEVLQNRFARASGLSDEKMEELNKITGFFRKPELDEED